MSGRRIMQHRTADEVLSRPASAAVARLLGHRNVFTARAAGHDSDSGATLLQREGANGAICGRCGAEQLWVTALGKLARHHGLEIGLRSTCAATICYAGRIRAELCVDFAAGHRSPENWKDSILCRNS
jgi:hypothetical protein